MRFGTRSLAHQLLEDTVIFRPAIRITGTVLRNGADENRCCPNDLRPAYRNRKEMRVTKWDVRGENFVPANWASAIPATRSSAL